MTHRQDTTSAGWCSSPTLPQVRHIPQRPRRSLMMAQVQQQHKQQYHNAPPIPQNHPQSQNPAATPSKTTITQNKSIHQNSQPRCNVCRLVFFSNAPASAAAPAAPTAFPDDSGGSAASQTTNRNTRTPQTLKIIPNHKSQQQLLQKQQSLETNQYIKTHW